MKTKVKEITLFCFMSEVTTQLKCQEKFRTSETYQSTLNSFKRFRAGKDIPLRKLDTEQMQLYESYLQQQGLVRNTTSFYLRILRAVYNRAVKKRLITPTNPFANVYTGIDKTVKRSIPLEMIRRMKQLNLSPGSPLDYARDMFLFSFYTRGMSFVDMAYLKKTDLRNGVLRYRRRKTGQTLAIKWEKCMQEIVNKYDTTGSPYLLPIIIRKEKDARLQYQTAMSSVTRHLKEIGRQIGLNIPLTMYVARHSWANAAKNNHVPTAIISESLGHTSERTTEIYLASFKTNIIDKVNKQILDKLEGRKKKKKGMINLFVRD